MLRHFHLRTPAVRLHLPAPPRLPAQPMIEGGAGDVFTISLHQLNNYPVWKPPSSIDINLPDGITDREYLYLG